MFNNVVVVYSIVAVLDFLDNFVSVCYKKASNHICIQIVTFPFYNVNKDIVLLNIDGVATENSVS